MYANATYNSTVSVEGELIRDGQSVWTGAASGTAKNYGSAGSGVNYDETLNHALGKALINMFSGSGFTEALKQ